VPVSAPSHTGESGNRAPVHSFAPHIQYKHLYKTNAWKEASARFRKSNPLCAECAALGMVEPAAVTDHIVPHKGSPKLFWDKSNWQPLCKRHHDRKTGLGG
jgi:5-methylcytosine-specific restriction protein A